MTVGNACELAGKKPAGVTPSALSCDCRLKLRCRRGLEACNSMVNERLTDADGKRPGGPAPEPESSHTRRSDLWHH